MLELLKKLFSLFPGEVTIPLFYVYAIDEYNAGIEDTGWFVSFVVYTDARTWTGAADRSTPKPRQFFFRAVLANDFGDIVSVVSSDSLHGLMTTLWENAQRSGNLFKQKPKTFKFVMSKDKIQYDNRYF